MDDKTFSNLVKESIEKEEKNRESKEYGTRDKKLGITFDEMRKKVRKNFFIGFGCGLILAACSMWIFKPATAEEIEIKKQKEVSEMRNAEIIEAAKAIGMIFPEEIDTYMESLEETNNTSVDADVNNSDTYNQSAENGEETR